jgi:hypothetical protein
MPEHACARCPVVASVLVTMCSECVGISEHFAWNLAFPPFFSPSMQFTSGCGGWICHREAPYCCMKYMHHTGLVLLHEPMEIDRGQHSSIGGRCAARASMRPMFGRRIGVSWHV